MTAVPRVASLAGAEPVLVPVPADGDVHLWRIPLDRPALSLGDLRSYLSQDERERMRRYIFQRDREHFVTARGCLRVILSRYAGCRPNEIQFGCGVHGKPFLIGSSAVEGLSFNLSHSGNVGLCVVTLWRQVGIDIERVRPEVDILGIARTTFSPDECARLEALPAESRVAAFFHCWTRKEAYIKARGEGLSYPLDAFDVRFEPGLPAELLRSAEGQDERQRWVFQNIDVGAGYAAALAVERPISRLILAG